LKERLVAAVVRIAIAGRAIVAGTQPRRGGQRRQLVTRFGGVRPREVMQPDPFYRL